MLKTQGTISAFQTMCILFICRAVDIFTAMSHLQASLNTSQHFIAMCLYIVFSLLLSAPVLLFITLQSKTDLLCVADTTLPACSKVIRIFYSIFFLFSAIIGVVRIGAFARTVLLQQTSLTLFFLLFIAIAVFSAYKGVEAIARSVVIFAFILAASLLFIVVGVGKNVQLLNIQLFTDLSVPALAKQAFFYACGNTQTTALFVLAPQIKGNLKKNVLCFFPSFGILTGILFLLAAAVMGNYANLQMYPLYALSVLAKIGFIERTDDLLTGIWVVCSMFSTSFLLYTASECSAFSQKRTSNTAFRLLCATGICGICVFLSKDIETVTSTLTNPVLPLAFLAASVLLPCILLLLAHRKETNNR